MVEKFHERKFKQSQYVCVFLDAAYIPLRRGTVEREAVNVAIGIRSDGGKEVLDYSIAPTRTEPLGLNYSKDYAHGGLKIFSCSSPTTRRRSFNGAARPFRVRSQKRSQGDYHRL